MTPTYKTAFTTLTLTVVAGYCDTLTYVSADNLFSAHVTGNFIVFAYQLVNGSDLHSWIKLLSFPIFILSVMLAGWVVARSTNSYRILLLEGILLLLVGFVTFITKYFLHTAFYPMAMVVVFAMGLQNAFGKLFAKETFGPTTMMTGNVTQASLDFENLLAAALNKLQYWESLKKQLLTIGGFLFGCLAGAILGKHFGLYMAVLPGLAIVICYYSTRIDPAATA